jgi:hypothetical protein
LSTPQEMHWPYKHFFLCHSSSFGFSQTIICHIFVVPLYTLDEETHVDWLEWKQAYEHRHSHSSLWWNEDFTLILFRPNCNSSIPTSYMQQHVFHSFIGFTKNGLSASNIHSPIICFGCVALNLK